MTASAPNASHSAPRAMLTPCIGVCTLHPAGYCDGCLRTGEEIGRWSAMSDEERLRIMNVVLPEREQRLADTGHPSLR